MSVFDTLGVEIETDVVTQQMAARIVDTFSRGEFKVDRDASVESPAFRTRGGASILTRKFAGTGVQKAVLGSEIVSAPLKLEDFRIAVRNLTMYLRTSGEPEISKRSSIHIHVGCRSDLYILKNALRLFQHIEPLFYRLGGMGYNFRGIYNSSIYCRPLSIRSGPPVVKGENGRLYSIFNPADLLEADSVEKFWYIMGIDPNRAGRYHPSRYFGLNLFSTILHGTLEFRFFNKTLNHNKICSVAALCQGITEWAVTNDKEVLNDTPLKNTSDEDLLEFTINLVKKNKIHTLSDMDIYSLRSIVSTTTAYMVPEGFVKSHLIDKFALPDWFFENYKRQQIDRDNANNSGFLDIHNYQNNNDMLDNIS
jgi:hypothetical protein